MTPEISVLIPVYNAAKYLPQCLESLSAQTFKDFEIVCVDDGSTDASAAVLKDFSAQEPRLHVIAQKNAGVAAARNRLLKQARGKYIVFVDADDWVKPGYLAKLYAAAEKEGADVVRCLFEEYNEQTGSVIPCDKRYRDYAAHKKEPFSYLERFQGGRDDSQVWGKLVRADLVRRYKLGFCTGCAAEDVSFEILLYLHAENIVFLNEYLLSYRVGLPSSITADKRAMARGIALNLCHLSEELDRRGFDLPEIYGALLKLMVKSIRRFRHVEIKEEDVFLFEKVRVLIDKHRARCFCWERWKYGCFARLTRGAGAGRMIFWSRLLR